MKKNFFANLWLTFHSWSPVVLLKFPTLTPASAALILVVGLSIIERSL